MAEGGLDVPALDKRPFLEPHEHHVIECYLRLSGSRPPTFSGNPAPVPISEVAVAYEFLRLDTHYTRTEFVDLVRMLDEVVYDFAKEHRTKKKPSKKPRGE